MGAPPIRVSSREKRIIDFARGDNSDIRSLMANPKENEEVASLSCVDENSDPATLPQPQSTSEPANFRNFVPYRG